MANFKDFTSSIDEIEMFLKNNLLKNKDKTDTIGNKMKNDDLIGAEEIFSLIKKLFN